MIDGKLTYWFLLLSIFLIFFIKTGKYLDSFGYAVAITFIIVFFIAHLKLLNININNNNFDGAKVELIIDKDKAPS